MKTGFVICSRSDSNRLAKKPFARVNGIKLIVHLVRRCLNTGYPVILAIPHRDLEQYRSLKEEIDHKDFHLFCGSADDPLKRTQQAAHEFDLDCVIRVTHDKIFIEKSNVEAIVEPIHKFKADYTFSSQFMPGSSMEGISRHALDLAVEKFKDVEFIGYAIRCVVDTIKDVKLEGHPNSGHRLLVDYPEDLKVLDLVVHAIGDDCTLAEAVAFLDQHYWISRINKHPEVTVYTSALNAQKWITKCMGSVAQQSRFANCEYILIDDCSKDSTAILMSKFCSTFKNSRLIRNQENLGLASCSNIALKHARGRWIVRIDADDYFVGDTAIEELVKQADISRADIVYPDNYFGSFGTVQSGDENHHVGGALFNTKAANHVKFTDGLRGYEGLDFFRRAKSQLRIGYLKKPVFFYRQHDASLTKNNLDERENIRHKILKGIEVGNSIGGISEAGGVQSI